MAGRKGFLQPKRVTNVTFAMSPYTATSDDETITVDTSGGSVTVNLVAAPADTQYVCIKKITTDANTMTIGRNGSNITGAAANIVDSRTDFPDYIMQFDLTNNSWWQLDQQTTLAQQDIAPNTLDATVTANFVSAGTIAAIDGVFVIPVADASANVDVIVTQKVKIVDFWFVSTGIAAAAGDTVTLQNGATPITNAVSKTTTAKALVRPTTFDDTQCVIAAGGTLRIAAVHVTNVSGIAYVSVVRSA